MQLGVRAAAAAVYQRPPPPLHRTLDFMHCQRRTSASSATAALQQRLTGRMQRRRCDGSLVAASASFTSSRRAELTRGRDRRCEQRAGGGAFATNLLHAGVTLCGNDGVRSPGMAVADDAATRVFQPTDGARIVGSRRARPIRSPRPAFRPDFGLQSATSTRVASLERRSDGRRLRCGAAAAAYLNHRRDGALLLASRPVRGALPRPSPSLSQARSLRRSGDSFGEDRRRPCLARRMRHAATC